MNVSVIIPAAGVGRRFSDSAGILGATSKIEQDLAGQPVFMRALELFLSRGEVKQIVLAVNPESADEFRFRWGDKLGFHGVVVVPGGERERWETVQRALEAVPQEATHVAVHDAARPLAPTKMIDRVFEAAASHAAVIPAIAVADTLKRVQEVAGDQDAPADPLDAILGPVDRPKAIARRVTATIDRAGLVQVQTPQMFEAALLRRAYQQIADGKLDPTRVTDDASLIEALGEPVHVVDGEATNFKITRQDDLDLARLICEQRRQMDAASAGRKRLFGDDDE